MKKPDAQTELLMTAWRKAFQQGELTLQLPSKSDLTNIRFKLYNVSKQVKKWLPGTDADLQNAVDNCSITTSDEGGRFTLTIYRKDKSLLLQAIAYQMGETINMPKSTLETTNEEAEALARIMGKVSQADSGQPLTSTGEPRRPTPYDKLMGKG